MASGEPSRLSALELPSEQFVESCGAVLLDLADTQNKKVCIIQPSYSKEYLLAKGRRNIGESRKDAALREVMEETGYRCRLFPVTMTTRATLPTARADIKDKARTYDDLTEPIWCTFRQLKNRTKIIWWYIAILEEDGEAAKLPGEDMYRPLFVSCDKALSMLTYESDRNLLTKAIALVNATIQKGQAPPASDKPTTRQDARKLTRPQRSNKRKKRSAAAKRGEIVREAAGPTLGSPEVQNEGGLNPGFENQEDRQVETHGIAG